MTTVDLYKQLKEGKITESKFLYEVRRDTNLPFITNLTSFKDAEQILKNKSIIKEWAKDDKEIISIIDKLNPYRFKRAMYAELGKLGDVDEATYIKVREKVARKMAEDPMAYREEEFINSKDIEKKDAKLKMQPVSKGFKHEGQSMQKVKGQQNLKAQHAPKTENKKGKPKGVKELTYHAKKAKGIAEIMPETKKEKIVESLFRGLFKKKIKLAEDTHHRFGPGQSVPLPEKDRLAFGCESGTIKDIKGGTLYLELEVIDEQGQPLKISRQINVIEHEMGGRPEVQRQDIEGPVKNRDGFSLKKNQKVKTPDNKEYTINGFMKDKNGKIYATINLGMHSGIADIENLAPVETPETDPEYSRRVFDRLPNYASVYEENKLSKQHKLKELFNKLKEASKKNMKEGKKSVKKEIIDPKTLASAQAGKTTLSVKKGSNDERQAQQKGLTYTSY